VYYSDLDSAIKAKEETHQSEAIDGKRVRTDYSFMQRKQDYQRRNHHDNGFSRNQNDDRRYERRDYERRDDRRYERRNSQERRYSPEKRYSERRKRSPERSPDRRMRRSSPKSRYYNDNMYRKDNSRNEQRSNYY